eukprot:scaffold22974_cov126-Skeletonema_marinoi.AAC.1
MYVAFQGNSNVYAFWRTDGLDFGAVKADIKGIRYLHLLMFIIIIVIIVKKEDFLSPDDRVAQSRLLAGVCRRSGLLTS